MITTAIDNTLSDNSRVWIYQINRTLSTEETATINSQLAEFARQWVSHNQQLAAYATIFHQRFIVLMVDENKAGASGCSIDASVHFLKQLETTHQIDVFDRMSFAYKIKDGIEVASRHEFSELYQKGIINDTTLVFDNLVNTKADFEKKWQKPLGESWHKRMV